MKRAARIGLHNGIHHRSTIAGADRTGQRRFSGRLYPRRAGATLILLAAAAATLAWRRLAGALVNPLEPALLLTAGAVTIAAAGVVRAGWPRTAHAPLDWIVTAGASLAAVALLAALCLPGTRPLWIAVLAIMLAAEEAWVWVRVFRRGPSRMRPSLAAAGTSALKRTPGPTCRRPLNIHPTRCRRRK